MFWANATGQLFEVDAGAEHLAREQGLSPASAEQIRAHEDRRKHGGLAEQAKALGETLIRGATSLPGAVGGALADLGAPPEAAAILLGAGGPQFLDQRKAEEGSGRYAPALPGFGTDEEIRGRQRQLEKEHPVISFAAEVAPEVALGLATGGLAAAPGAAARTVLARGAAALGAESLVSGISQEATDSYLQDRQFSGESALINGGIGFALGGAVGLSAFGVTRGLRRLKKARASAPGAAADSIPQENVLPQIESSVGKHKPSPKSVGAAATDDYSDKMTRAVRSFREEGLDQEAVLLSQNADPILRAATVDVDDRLNRLYQILEDDLGFAVKAEDVRLTSRDWTPEMVLNQSRGILNLVEERGDKAIQEIAELGEDFSLKATGSQTIDLINAGRARVLNAQTPADLFLEADQLKRTVDKQINRIARNQTYDETARNAWIDKLESWNDDLRSFLQSENDWGLAGRLQRETNQAWVNLIAPMNRVNKRLAEISGENFGKTGASRLSRRARPDAIASFVRQNPEIQAPLAKDFDDMLSGLQQMANARAQGITKVDRLHEIHEAAEGIRDRLNLTTLVGVAQKRAANLDPTLVQQLLSVAERAPGGLGRAVSAARGARSFFGANALRPGTPVHDLVHREIRELSKNPRVMAPEMIEGMGDSFVGSELLKMSPPTRSMGAVVPAAGIAGGLSAFEEGQTSQSEASLRTQEAFGNIGLGTRAKVESGARNLAKLAQGKDPSESPESKRLKKMEDSTGRSRAVVRFAGTRDPLEVYRERREFLLEAASDPGVTARMMGAGWGALPQLEPNLYGSMVAKAQQVVQYLRQALPDQNGRTALNPSGDDPGEWEVESFAGIWQGAVNALSVLEDLATQDAPEESVRAVRELWPDQYALFQRVAVGEITRELESSGDVDWRASIYLDSALGLEGAADPLLGPGLYQHMDQAVEAENQGKQGGAIRQPTPRANRSKRIGPSYLDKIRGI